MLRSLFLPHRALPRKNHRSIASLSNILARHAPVDVHPEVQEALANKAPVVALETTIVTHGMPHPTNLETAISVENIVREHGAIPTTIGIIGGRVKIGLERGQLEHLANTENDPPSVKISRRDIAAAIALKRDGGTTCSATLIFAAMAGIKVFATGGLGGVHRGGEHSMDVSADLQELTRCPVGLVSAGVKSILDIGRTLEYLETLGVPVISYGSTNDFPAFYSSRSGFMSPWRVNDPVAAASILYTQDQLGLTNGALFGTPIPAQYEAVGEQLQKTVEQAVQEADANGVSRSGKAVTPWLLNRVAELTHGRSLASNVALIQNTARVGGQIAVAYAKLTQEGNIVESTYPSASVQVADPSSVSTSEPTTALLEGGVTKGAARCELVVVGSAAADITAKTNTSDDALGKQSTSPGTVSMTLGGVGRNIAEAAHRILSGETVHTSRDTVLVAPVGNDLFGRMIADETEKLGMRTDGIVRVDGARSAVCNMVLDSAGNLVGGVADMDITQSLEPQTVVESVKKFHPRIVAVDGNLSEDVLSAVIRCCSETDIDVFFEPTSVVKSTRIWPAVHQAVALDLRTPITYASPNILELAQMYAAARRGPLELTSHQHWWAVIDNMALGSGFRQDLEHLARLEANTHPGAKGNMAHLLDKGIAQMSVNLLPFINYIIVKCGELGILTVFRIPTETAKVSSWAQETTNMKARQVVARGKDGETVVVKHFPAFVLPPDSVLNVTGAGDSLVGSILASLVKSPEAFLDPASLDTLVERSQKAAILTLSSPWAVSPELSKLK